MIETYLIQAGKSGVTKLAMTANCSPRIVYQVKNDGHIPRAEIVYRLAKACGLSDEDALALAKGCAPAQATDQAKAAG